MTPKPKTRRSKFQDIFDERDAPVTAQLEESPITIASRPPEPASEPAPKTSSKALAKSKDPNYTPITVYVRKDTYQNIQMRLLATGRRREVSELTNELYEGWLEGQGTDA